MSGFAEVLVACVPRLTRRWKMVLVGGPFV
jgi:hypothetical protein